jgi:hypothetical protein
MRKHILSAVTALSLLATLTFVSLAAYSGRRLTADIPFAFAVGGKQLPAGTYVVRSVSTQGVMIIQNAETKEALSFLIRGGRTGKDTSAKLIFNKYGERRFLSEVWDGMSQSAHELPASGAERRLRQQAPNHLAAAQPEVISVTARAE